jgi:hypothetical protein
MPCSLVLPASKKLEKDRRKTFGKCGVETHFKPPIEIKI